MRFKPLKSDYLIIPILLLAPFCISVSAGRAESLDDKLAVVNDTVITRRELNKEINIFKDRLAKSGDKISDIQLEVIKAKILESLIEQELLLQESRNKGVTVLPQEIDEQVAMVRNRYPTREAFLVAIERNDFTEAELRKRITKVYTINRFINTHIIGNIAVTEEAARSYYDSNRNLFKQSAQVRASLILIKLDPMADAEVKKAAEKKIKMIQGKLDAGADFTELARQYSEDPSSANGGDLGYFSRGEVVKSVENIAFILRPNAVSDVVRTPVGYQIIKVVDKKPEINPSYEDVKGRIIDRLRKGKVQDALSQYVGKLKDAAKIERYLE